MTKRNDQTASFMVRFNQKIYQDNEGLDQVQWRGKISHVQGGDQSNFSEFSEVISFIQDKLSGLTKQATEDRTPEEQEGILTKSLDMWKKLSTTGAKMAIETIKDPRRGVAQIQEQISQVGEELGSKIEMDNIRSASKADLQTVLKRLEEVSADLRSLHSKVDAINDK